MDNVNKITWDKCTGCCLCENVCPSNAITMQENFQGFIHPVIDEQKCIDCGKCFNDCPVREPKYSNNANPECRAVWAKDEIRMTSASGGIFAAFAEIILNRGGVVCGAAYDKDFSVKHIMADNMSDMEKIKSSKYIQSNAGDIYQKVKSELEAGREVLFSGCPCQVAALYSFLQYKEYSKLYTMDLVCHGVPSPKVLRQYIDENFKGKEIDRIDFRDKSHFGWSTEMNIYLKNGEVFRKHHDDDSFYKAFLPCLSIRKSCGTCPFSHIPRQGDLSLGDFWGISRYNNSLNDKKGTSLLLVNNKKGKKMLEQCNKLLEHNEIVPIEEGLRINKTISHPFRSHPARKRFFENLGKIPLDILVDKCIAYHYDIGIAGLWYGLNYGSILTYYALYKVVNSMGHDAIMINKPEELWTPRYADRNSIANKFIYDKCYVSNPRKLSDSHQLNHHCDTFIVGSDVVWNYQICGRESKQFFFLDFVKDEKKKIAMASSFGAGYDAPEQERTLSEYYLKKFDYVGVREDEGVDICKNKFNVAANKIMDPVFLCDRNEYVKLAESSRVSENEHFISSYILGPDNVKKDILVRASEILGLPLRSLPNPNNPKRFTEVTGLPSLDEPSVEDWLYYIKNADFFIGDSFHGLCFALIFKIPFLITVNTNISGLCRFTTLLGMLGLEDRLMFTNKDDFKSKEKYLTEKIDYEKVDKILSEKANESYYWLKQAIEGPKRYKASAYEMLISNLSDKVNELERRIKELMK